MKRTFVSLAIVAICFAGICTSRAEDSAGQVNRPLMTLAGDDSQVKELSYHRITSEAEWIKIWQRHKGAKESKDYDLYYNPLGLPYIDFEKCMVIAVFQGSGWNSAGLKAVEIRENKEGIVLRFEGKGYQTAGPGGGGKKVTVYGFFILPHSDKTVILEENHPNMLGQPPIWKAVSTIKPTDTAKPTDKTNGAKTSFKGWELYVWQETGDTYFSLLPGTNRLKTDEEIKKAAVKGIDAIKPMLDELKPGEYVFVGGKKLTEPPPKDQVAPVVEYGKNAGLKMQGQLQ
jgi:hypothetical protein